MWIVKGLLAGIGVFAVFSVIYVIVMAGGVRQNVAIEIHTLKSWTSQSLLYWAAFGLTLATACVFSKLLSR